MAIVLTTFFFESLMFSACVGEMIRDLQARSAAKIDVDQNVPPGQPRIITYRGTREQIDFAKKLVHMLCQGGVNENDLPLGQAKRELLVVPAMTVGKIIGRGGYEHRNSSSHFALISTLQYNLTTRMPFILLSLLFFPREMIRELQNRSQAKIQVDHSGTSGVDPSEKQVTITGTEESVVKAKEMVLFLVANPSHDAMQSLNMVRTTSMQRNFVFFDVL
jgi:KH domain